MVVLLSFIALWYGSLFFQTLFQHRYASHSAFKMSKGWEKVFFIGSYLTQGSSYISPAAYAIMHRYHHAYTDTAQDPHSPSFSPNIFAMMWRTRTFYQNIVKGRMEVEPRFTKNLPEWPLFDRLANSTVSRIIWVTLYILFFAYFATSLWQWLLLPIVITMGAFHGAVVNWFAHKYGYVNFKLKNTSMNLLRVDFLMLGESYHNNHHKRPSAINFGRRWHEFDPMYPLIKALAWMKVIKLNNVVAVAPGVPVLETEELV